MANLVVHFEIHPSEPQRLIDFYRDLFGWSLSRWPWAHTPASSRGDRS